MKEEKVDEVKPIQKNINRYQSATAKKTPEVHKKAEEEVESKPIPETTKQE